MPHPQKLKVLVIDPSFFTPLYDHSFCDALVDKGHQVLLLTRKPRPGEAEAEHLRYDKKPLFYKLTEFFIRRFPKHKKSLLFLKGIEHIFNWIQVLLILRKDNFSAVHVQWLVVPVIDRFFIKLMQKKTPVIFTLHDTQFFLGAPSSKLQTIGYLDAVKIFDSIVVHTQEAIDSLVAYGIARSKITRITPGPIPFLYIKNPKPFIERKNQFLIFGALKPYKGTSEFFRAFAAVDKAHRKEWTIKICGHGKEDYVGQLKKLTRDLGIENLVEWDLRYIPESEIPQLLFDAKVIALPYKFIDLSGVLWSLLGQEILFLATSVGLFKEVIKDNKSGRLTAPEDAAMLEQVIKEIVAYPNTLPMMAYEFKVSSEKIKWPPAIEQIEMLYRASSKGTNS